MNTQEIQALFRIVRAVCPQQKTDEFAPDVWLELLAAYRLQDAALAVKAIGSRQPFISPGEIAVETRSLRERRLALIVEPPPNPVEGVRSYEELRALRRAIADGEIADQAAADRYTAWGGSLHLLAQRGQLGGGERREIA